MTIGQFLEKELESYGLTKTQAQAVILLLLREPWFSYENIKLKDDLEDTEGALRVKLASTVRDLGEKFLAESN